MIDFNQECYGNHRATSKVCPFCPLGLNCEWEQERKKKKLDEADARALEAQDITKISSKIDVLAFFINLPREIEVLNEMDQWLKTHLGYKRPLKSKNKLRVSHGYGKKYVLSDSDFWEDEIGSSEKRTEPEVRK